MKISRKHLIIAVVIAAAIIAFLFRSSLGFDLISLDNIIHLVEYARSKPWLSFGFYLIFIVGVMCLPITLFPIIGGVLFPFWISFPLNVMAATAGGWCSFMVTRIFGREAIEPLLKGKFKLWDKFSSVQGFKAVLFLRIIGVPPFIVTNYALGFSSVNHFDFLTATMIGMLPWMGIVTYLAQSLWAAVLVGGQKGLASALGHIMMPLMLISLTIVAMMLVNYFIKKRRHSNL